MLEKVRENFLAGIEKVKWFSNVLSDRVKIELAVIKLLNESKTLEEKRGNAAKAIGERVFELRTHESADILNEPKVKEALKEIERLNAEIEDIKNRVSVLGRPED